MMHMYSVYAYKSYYFSPTPGLCSLLFLFPSLTSLPRGVFLTSPLVGTLSLALVTPLSIAYSIVVGSVSTRVCVCVRACMRACVRVCACVCVCVCVCVHTTHTIPHSLSPSLHSLLPSLLVLCSSSSASLLCQCWITSGPGTHSGHS